MKTNSVKRRSAWKSGFTFGVILIIIGAIFLAFNFGFLQSGLKHVIFSWQMLLIVVGLFSVFHKHIFNGLTLIVVGGFFIIPRLGEAYPDIFYWVQDDFRSTYWPVLLIVAGILVMLHIIIRPKHYGAEEHANCSRKSHEDYKRYPGAHRSGLNKDSVFANIEEIVLDPEFTGGEMNAVFGNIVLDLRKTNLPEGVTELEVNAVFGGITVYVPETWNIELHLSNVFGGFHDNRNRILAEEVDNSRKLVIIGACVFAGGEVRN